MELRFWMKYVACVEQPDGKTPNLQGRLLPPLGFVDEVLPPRLGEPLLPAGPALGGNELSLLGGLKLGQPA